MEYTLSYIQRGKASTEAWVGSFAEAKAHAKKAVLLGSADRTEIRDNAGKLVFHYPRVLHHA